MATIGSTRRRYGFLGVGAVLLTVGVFLAIETFASPIAGTGAACPPGATQWELFGISLPILRFTGIDLLRMEVSWHDGCNGVTGSLWLLMGGLLGLVSGSVLLTRGVMGGKT